MDPIEPKTWQQFFDEHAPYYDQNEFTKNTLVEVQFLKATLELKAGMRLLDLGCGTGRHAVELASAGLQVTGVDLSEGMLHQARQKALRRGVEVEWVQADATQWSRQESFDVAISLCEGGFGLINHDQNAIQHDLALLQNVATSLKPGGKFLLTALNGYAVIRRMTDEHTELGVFDPATMEMYYVDDMALPEGNRAMLIHERLFIPPELAAMAFHAGFQVLNIWGGTAGDWGERPLKLDEIEVMMVLQKR